MASGSRWLEAARRAPPGPLERAGSVGCLAQPRLPCWRDLVIAARWALLALRGLGALPGRPQQPFTIESAENRIDRAARKAGRVHDVESVMEAAGERLENEGSRKGQVHSWGHAILARPL